MTGTIVAVSSSNIISTWMGLEINLISFIPLMANKTTILSNESIIKYFLIQTIGSITFLFSNLLNSFNGLFYFIEINNFNTLIIFSLILKLAAAPLHHWIIDVIEGLSWIINILLLTWQKIAPIFILFSLLTSSVFLPIFIILSAAVGALGGVPQTSLKKIIAYSSINHMAWMFITLGLPHWVLLTYLSIYILLRVSIITIFINFNLTFINQVIINFYFKIKIIFFIPLLSLGGLPPLTGFFSKWIVIMNGTPYSILLTLILITSSLVTLFYYVQLSLSSIITISTSSKLFLYINEISPPWAIITLISRGTLPLFLLL